MTMKGLSPRVRGNHHWRRRCELARGSIPACAGEPAAQRGRVAISGVYPRVCGGTGHAGEIPIIAKGLSPRVRGNLHRMRFPV